MSEQNHSRLSIANLMTAGNLFCGFTATLKITRGALLQSSNSGRRGRSLSYRHLVHSRRLFFDLPDGRLARLGAPGSMFGREFDSWPTLFHSASRLLSMVCIVLQEFPRACWIIAFIYLACGALRLARTASANHGRADTCKQNFTGFPFPLRLASSPPSLSFCSGWPRANITSATGSSCCRR